MNKTTAALLCTATLAGLSTPPAAAQSTSTSPNAASDPAVSFATSLVAKMTQDEKISQVVNNSPAIPRLKVPAYAWWTEGLHGAVADIATTDFPIPPGLAASFDEDLTRRVAAAVGTEVRANHTLKIRDGELGVIGSGLHVWSPTINIFRDPRWGRGQETYGEDPFLAARMTVAFVNGIQGPDPANPLLYATPKHFAVHSGPETGRSLIDARVSEHDLEDTYFPAFRAAFVDAKAGAVMCSYNYVNGVPACTSDYLLQTKLRRDWNFKGLVTTDCGAITNLLDTQKYAKDWAAGVGQAFRAGVDTECDLLTLGSWKVAEPRYSLALKRGDLTKADLDRALVNLFAARYRVGDLETAGGKAFVPVAASELNSPAHVALARQAAVESMVLLKNGGVLPLANRRARIAVVGPLADATRVLRGSYSSGLSLKPVSVLDGLRAAMPDAIITYVPAGASITDGDIVPTSALLTPDGKPGLQTDYYSAVGDPHHPVSANSWATLGAWAATLVYEKRPAITQIDPEVNRTWIIRPPQGVTEQYKVVWHGFLVPPASGSYRLGFKGPGQMTIDGRTLSLVGDQLPIVKLEAERRYAIEISSPKQLSVSAQLLWKRISDAPIPTAVAAAQDADLVIAVVGITSELEAEEMPIKQPGFEGGDRTSLDLPTDQQQLLEAVKSTGKPLVVVSMSGSALNLSWAQTHADAILQAWYPGQQGGAAVADVLTGAANPAGRLPVTFYRSIADLPPFNDYSMANRTYRYFSGKPLYPFGYGLSYTRFTYSRPQVSRDGDAYLVTTTVANVGKRDGDEAAQLYLTFPKSPGVPQIALRAFQRLTLKHGEQRQITFHLSPRDLSSVSAAGVRSVLAGTYRVIVGGGQPGTAAPTAEAKLTVDQVQPIAK